MTEEKHESGRDFRSSTSDPQSDRWQHQPSDRFGGNEQRGGNRGGYRGGHQGGGPRVNHSRGGGRGRGSGGGGGGFRDDDGGAAPPERASTEEFVEQQQHQGGGEPHRFERHQGTGFRGEGGGRGGRGRGQRRFEDPNYDESDRPRGGGRGGRRHQHDDGQEHPSAEEGTEPRGYERRPGRGGGRGGEPRYPRRHQEADGGEEAGPQGGSDVAAAAERFQVLRRDDDPQHARDGPPARASAGQYAPPQPRAQFPPRQHAHALGPDDMKPQRYQERPRDGEGRREHAQSREHAPRAATGAHPAAASQYEEHESPNRTQRAPRLRRNNFNEQEVEQLFQSRHNQKGISFEKYESIAVEIVPNDVDAATSFEGFALHPLLEANIKRCGYVKPTPVQKYGIPVALSGKDLMACAQTGSGKTAAFLVPVVQHILVHGVSPAERRCSYPIALVMAPTRELALQIYDESRKLVFKTDIFCDVVYGGTAYPTYFEQDILVACPGRLKDIFDQEMVSFSRIKFLVLDEADRQLEMGFEEQIEYLVGSPYTDMPPPEERQTLMFSATFPVPIRNLAQKYLRRHYYLLTVGRVGSTTTNIKQRLLWVEEEDKQQKLMDLLFQQNQTDLVLIFVETKASAEDLYALLYDEGIPSSTIHGGRKQYEREEALKRFKEGRTPILVATDVASRGLDIPNVAHVIQYDLPRSMDDYTHRIGRTARAGNAGTATSFFNAENSAMTEELLAYLREHDQEVPDWMESMKDEREMQHFVSQTNRPGGRRGGRGGGRGGSSGRWGSRNDDYPTSWDDDSSRPQGSRRGGGAGGGRGDGSAPKPQPKKIVLPTTNVADGGF